MILCTLKRIKIRKKHKEKISMIKTSLSIGKLLKICTSSFVHWFQDWANRTQRWSENVISKKKISRDACMLYWRIYNHSWKQKTESSCTTFSSALSITTWKLPRLTFGFNWMTKLKVFILRYWGLLSRAVAKLLHTVGGTMWHIWRF